VSQPEASSERGAAHVTRSSPDGHQFVSHRVARLGKQAGTKEMVGLLKLGRTHGQPALRRAIEAALALGVQDSAAVQHLVAAPQLERVQPARIDVGALAAYERPLPDLCGYDALLAVAG